MSQIKASISYGFQKLCIISGFQPWQYITGNSVEPLREKTLNLRKSFWLEGNSPDLSSNNSATAEILYTVPHLQAGCMQTPISCLEIKQCVNFSVFSFQSSQTLHQTMSSCLVAVSACFSGGSVCDRVLANTLFTWESVQQKDTHTQAWKELITFSLVTLPLLQIKNRSPFKSHDKLCVNMDGTKKGAKSAAEVTVCTHVHWLSIRARPSS